MCDNGNAPQSLSPTCRAATLPHATLCCSKIIKNNVYFGVGMMRPRDWLRKCSALNYSLPLVSMDAVAHEISRKHVAGEAKLVSAAACMHACCK